MELRRDRSLNKPFAILDAKGVTNEEVTKLLSDSIAFNELLTILFETPYWGHSLLELTPS